MAYLPVNDRSEFVEPRNFSDGGVLETTFMFQVASAASILPARRPTRGSVAGLGAAAVVGAALDDDEQAARVSDPRAMVSERSAMGRRTGCAVAMEGSCNGTTAD